MLRPGYWLPVVCAVILSCSVRTTSEIPDQKSSAQLGDAYMSNLVNEEIALAYSKMEASLRLQVTLGDMEAALKNTLRECGAPIDYELRHQEIGWKLYPDGTRNPTRKLFYSVSTTKYARGRCVFSVEVVPDEGHLAVTSFAPLTALGGRLPSWAR